MDGVTLPLTLIAVLWLKIQILKRKTKFPDLRKKCSRGKLLFMQYKIDLVESHFTAVMAHEIFRFFAVGFYITRQICYT